MVFQREWGGGKGVRLWDEGWGKRKRGKGKEKGKPPFRKNAFYGRLRSIMGMWMRVFVLSDVSVAKLHFVFLYFTGRGGRGGQQQRLGFLVARGLSCQDLLPRSKKKRPCL